LKSVTNSRVEARQQVQTIAVVGVVHGISHFYQLVLPALYPWLMRDFDLSFTQVGVAMTTFFVVSGFGQSMAGILVDRYGAPRVLMAGLALLGVATLVLAASASYSGLILAGALAGMGNAVFHPADFSLLNHRVSASRLSHAFSIHGLSGSIGWATAPLTMALLANHGNWQTAALGASFVAVVGILLLLFIKPGNEAHVASAGEATGKVVGTLDFLKVPAVWLCFGFFALTAMALGALQNYLPAAGSHLFGLPAAGAALALTAYMLGNAAGTLTGGFVAAGEVSRDGIVAAMLGLAALLAAVVATGWVPVWSVAPLLGLIGFASGMAGPSRDLMVRHAATARFGKAAYGRIYGFVYSGLDVGMAMAPLAFGPLMDKRLFVAPLIGVAVLQTGAALTALSIGKAVPKK
jgi:MFS family permease